MRWYYRFDRSPHCSRRSRTNALDNKGNALVKYLVLICVDAQTVPAYFVTTDGGNSHWTIRNTGLAERPILLSTITLRKRLAGFGCIHKRAGGMKENGGTMRKTR
jgi:hypothetical protein